MQHLINFMVSDFSSFDLTPLPLEGRHVKAIKVRDKRFSLLDAGKIQLQETINS